MPIILKSSADHSLVDPIDHSNHNKPKTTKYCGLQHSAHVTLHWLKIVVLFIDSSNYTHTYH